MVHYVLNFSIALGKAKIIPIVIKNWVKADWIGIGAALEVMNWNTLFSTCNDVNAMWNAFANRVSMLIEEFVPVKTVSFGKKP